MQPQEGPVRYRATIGRRERTIIHLRGSSISVEIPAARKHQARFYFHGISLPISSGDSVRTSTTNLRRNLRENLQRTNHHISLQGSRSIRLQGRHNPSLRGSNITSLRKIHNPSLQGSYNIHLRGSHNPSLRGSTITRLRRRQIDRRSASYRCGQPRYRTIENWFVRALLRTPTL